MHDRTEAFIRSALSGSEVPQLAPTLSADVLRQIRVFECSRRGRPPLTTRVLLAASWLAVAVGSSWILWSLPWPVWIPSASTLSGWLIPIAGTALLLGDRA